jgi:hypothetical protein
MLDRMLKAANDNRYIPPLTPAQLVELDRRCAEADAGLAPGEPWEIVMQRILGNPPRR